MALFSANSAGFFQSTDDGATWTSIVGSALPAAAGKIINNGFFVFASGTWLIVTNDVGASGIAHMYTSTNQGVTWTETAGSPDTFGGGGSGANWCYIDETIQITKRDNLSLIVSSDKFATRTNVTLANQIGTSSSGFNNVGTIVKNPGGRFAAAGNGLGAYSDNGTVWTFPVITYPAGYSATSGIAYNPGAGAIITCDTGGSKTGSILKDTDGSGNWSTVFVSGDATGGGASGSVSQPVGAYTPTAAALGLWVDGGGTSIHTIISSDGNSWSTQGIATGPFGGVGTSIFGLWRTPGGAYVLVFAQGAGNPSMARSTDGHAWTTVTGLAGAVQAVLASPFTALITAKPTEFPHFPDRGLPIEIAGPRNDQTRRNYLPTVRIFGS